MNFQLAINPASTCEEDFFTGRIELTPEERGTELPACIEVTAAVCTNPGCDCGEICLHLPPLDPDARRILEEGEPPIPRLIVLITEFEEAQPEFVELDEPNLQALARKLPELLTPEHWEALNNLYKEARTRLAETCNIASYDQIPEWLRSISGRSELRDVEASFRDLFSFPLDFGLIDDTRWFFEEFYPVPNTPSPFWVTVEFRLTADGLDPDLTPEQYEEICDDPDGFPEHSCPTLKLRWNLDTGEVTELSRSGTDLPVERFFNLLMQVRPDARERFRRRHQHLVQSIAKVPAWIEANPHEPAWDDSDVDWPDQPSEADCSPPPEPLAPTKRATPKVGRNDPCPCGSGKKFKKCCGG